jgi:hypothetical protein
MEEANKILEKSNELELRAIEINSPEAWSEAFNLLREANLKNSSAEITTRFLFLCWFMLTEKDIYKHNFDYEYLSKFLKEGYEDTREKYANNAFYLWVMGYIIQFSPYYFEEFELEAMEKTGKKMLEKAHSLDPDNKFIEINLISEFNEQYFKMSREIQPLVDNYFAGQGILGYYFKKTYSPENI